VPELSLPFPKQPQEQIKKLMAAKRRQTKRLFLG
jgi:hypothetical protein